eukprot:6211905-Pleurochrysis_carterae.AAC.1
MHTRAWVRECTHACVVCALAVCARAAPARGGVLREVERLGERHVDVAVSDLAVSLPVVRRHAQLNGQVRLRADMHGLGSFEQPVGNWAGLFELDDVRRGGQDRRNGTLRKEAVAEAVIIVAAAATAASSSCGRRRKRKRTWRTGIYMSHA